MTGDRGNRCNWPPWPLLSPFPTTQEIWEEAVKDFIPKPDQKVRIMVSTPAGLSNVFLELMEKQLGQKRANADDAYLCYRHIPDPPGAMDWIEEIDPSPLEQMEKQLTEYQRKNIEAVLKRRALEESLFPPPPVVVNSQALRRGRQISFAPGRINKLWQPTTFKDALRQAWNLFLLAIW